MLACLALACELQALNLLLDGYRCPLPIEHQCGCRVPMVMDRVVGIILFDFDGCRSRQTVEVSSGCCELVRLL